ncbi:MAG: redoxin domain-containing protein [Flavobacteriales bacterium]
MTLRKLILIGLWSAAVNLNGFAQKAPDFTFTDTKGVEWSLYDQLGQNKVVILDFFFVDCVPCQTLTPAVESIYNDFGTGQEHLIVFGISDRDINEKVLEFEDLYGVTYPTCGLEGGGDTITSYYSIGFPFIGWPTYAVVCHDTSIIWNLPRNEGLPELRAAADSCVSVTAGILSDFSKRVPIYPNPADQYIYVSSEVDHTVELFSSDGRLQKSVWFDHQMEAMKLFIGDLPAGLYYIIDHQNGNKEYSPLIISR